MELRVPTVDEFVEELVAESMEEMRKKLMAMTHADVERHAHEFEVTRRKLEAASALMVQRVDAAGVYAAEGHCDVGAWGRDTNHWSSTEAARFVALGRAFGFLPRFAAACEAGLIGVAQMHAVATVVANPRVRDHVAEADDLFTDAAKDQSFEILITLLRRWEALADV